MSIRAIVCICCAVSILFWTAGCESHAKTGAAAGGGGGAVAGGAAAGAAAGAPAAGAGAIVGGAIGATAGAILGSAADRNDQQREAAIRASSDNPVLASAVVEGADADINEDGFVTLDEVVALEKSGLSDDEIIARCRSTQHIFQLTDDQRRRLVESGVSPRVADALKDLNRDLVAPKDGAR
jgi:hypothetical protein